MAALSLNGVLSTRDCAETAAWIASVQLPSGAIPWFPGGHTDPWDHVQAAMGLSVCGRVAEAERAYEWMRDVQRSDGTWAAKYVGSRVTDAMTDANFCAYVATGTWHHWRITDDRAFLRRMWPTVRAAVDSVLAMQSVDGTIRWARGTDGRLAGESLVTGNASIHLSLRCAVALAEAMGIAVPDWELAASRLRHALDEHPERYTPKDRHAMDWYYPVLGGALRPDVAGARIDGRWDAFVTDGLGIRCVHDHPWVTGAETCELVLALDVLGRRDEAASMLAAMQHLRDDDGSYWTGLVYSDGKRWPVEQSTWTAATVLLATDVLAGSTLASGLFRGEGLPACDLKEPCPCLTP